MPKSLLSAALIALAVPATAGQTGDVIRTHLEAGTLAAGIEALAPLVATDQEARFGTGLIRFVQGLEGLAQGFYRHGLAVPEAGPDLPPLLLQVPVNPDPEPLDYAELRALFEGFVANMDAACDDLLLAAESGDYVLPLDIMKFRIDLDGDGTSTPAESLGGVMAQMLGAEFNAPAPGGKPAGLPEVTIGFDRADAYWLAGYSQVLAAQLDFLLAHDFHELVEVSFHRLFPRAGLPMQAFGRGNGALFLDPASESGIADLIAAIHTMNWPVTDAARLRGVLARFQSITQLSRQNWQAILAETDDNHELVPSPRQTPLMPEAKVTEEMVAAWLETLDTADQILSGELLLPHWRFARGFDLKAYFETATRTDLVLLLTGAGALPYLRDGPIASAQSFSAGNRVFGDQFLGYVFWFN